VVRALRRSPAVREVRLVGSRAEGREHDRSDWDFVVESTDFEGVSHALPALLAHLDPLVQQWDRLSNHPCWMLILPGPVKVDLIFAETAHQLEPPWIPSGENLIAIDQHFWDWILWLDSKPATNTTLHEAELRKMYEHLLSPLGVQAAASTIGEAVAAYRDARRRAEGRFGVRVPRLLEDEVLPALTASNQRA
jgi:hypothetical protein